MTNETKQTAVSMTPAQEKAEYLVKLFYPRATSYSLDRKNQNENAKECALVAVNEILNHHSQEQGLYRIDTYYWQQVKQEIEKL